MYYNYGFGYFLLHVLWWAVIIILIIWLVRLIAGGGRYHSRGNWHGNKDAMDILKERYAKGEINKEEFEQKKKDLMQS